MDTAFEQQLAEPFRLQAGSFTILVVTYEEIVNPDFIPWLEKKADASPYFLKDAPVVIDLGGAPDDIADEIARIATSLKVCGLAPVGVQNGSEEHYRAAAAIGLTNFPVWRSGAAKPAETEPAETDPLGAGNDRPETDVGPPPLEAKSVSLVISEPVRSGRQIYAEGGDLVVLAKVGAGAEIRADGHIHVYGTLRGRAFAGAKGDTSARIFCRSFEAELVSIAGLWRVREDFEEALIGRQVQIVADKDELIISPDG